MSEQAAQQWRELCESLKRYSTRLDRNNAVAVNSAALRSETRELSQFYFQTVRPLLLQHQLEELVPPLSDAFQALVILAEGRNLTASYKKQVKAIRRLIPRVTSQLMLQVGGSSPAMSSTETDQKILATLAAMIPSAEQSYRQALVDLADANRTSFRGPAHELRESLREVLDHLAPDAEMKKDGLKFEKDYTGKERATYTMKQRVRFVLKARGVGKTDSAAPEDAANAIDAVIADMTRSTYDQGSLVAHVQKGKASVDRLKRYVDVIFHDLLEL